MIDPKSEANSLAWSKSHRLEHIKKEIGRPACHQRAIDYAVRFQTNRTREFFRAINSMVDGDVVVSTVRLRSLLADVEAERQFRGK